MSNAITPNATLNEMYGATFERTVIKLLTHDASFSETLYNAITAECFEHTIYTTIFEVGKDLYDTTRHVPGYTALHAALTHHARTAKAGSKKAEAYTKAAKRLRFVHADKQFTEGDLGFARTHLGTFITKARVRAALLESGSLWQTNKFDDILANVEAAVHANERSIGADLGINFNHVKSKIRAYKTQRNSAHACPCGLPLIDSRMRGGLEPGALGIIMAPAKRGKSLFLVNTGAHALLRGLNVAVVSLELRKNDYSMRFDARLTGLPINEIALNPTKHVRIILRRTRRLTGRLFIQSWGSDIATVSDIHVWLKALKRKHDFTPNVLLVDYVDLLRSPNKRNDRADIGTLCKSLRQLGEDFSCAVWSASQTKRSSFHGRTVELDDVAEDIQKVQVADAILGYAQTAREKDNDKARIILLGNRQGGHEGAVVDCIVKTETMSLTQAQNQTTVLRQGRKP